jgi:hypothetical protein
MKLKSDTPMKSLVLALAISVTAIGLSQKAEAGMGGHGGFRGDFSRGYDFDRGHDFDHGRDFSRGSQREYSWNHSYWRSHRFGYWNNHRGYWSYRDHQHVFIDVD